MDPQKVAEILEAYGFHIDSIAQIERGYRISLKENAFIDIIYSEIIFYYLKNLDCRFLEIYRNNLRINRNDILSRGYIAGFIINNEECQLVIIKKIKTFPTDKLWDEYLNMIRIANLALKNSS